MYLQEDNIPFHPDLIMGKSLEILLYECYLQARHLRAGPPAVTLQRQLQVAMDMAPALHRESITEECRQMAQRHGLAAPRRRLNPLQWLRRLSPRLRIFCSRVVLNPVDLRVNNVLDASIASHYVYAFAKHGPFPWALLLAISSLQQLAARIKTRLG
jgi:hypothetical protein